MKILQIVPTLGSGGAERFVVDLSNELAERGHEIVLCSIFDLEGNNGFYKSQISDKVRIVEFNKGRGRTLLAIWNFFKLVRKEKPDVIHSHLDVLPYISLAECLLCRGVHTIHNEAKKEAGGKPSQLLRRILFRTKRVIPVTISKESNISFKKFYGFDAPIIFNGRNISSNFDISKEVKKEFEEYRRTPKTRCIVQLARFEPQKRIPLMTRVASRLASEGYDFSIINIGATNNLREYKAVVDNKPSCQYILGQKVNPLDYLKEAGAFALCSSYEGLPISLIEALGVGAVPICTPAGGIVDLIENDYNGLLSEDFEEESFYQAMKRYLELTDGKMKQLKENAIHSYRQYSMTECANNYTKLYYDFLNGSQCFNNDMNIK